MAVMTVRVLVVGFVALLLAACGSESPATPGVPSAESLISAALERARAEDKAVMVEFRADWCQWCARLDTALHSPELSKVFSDNYVIVNLTVQESEDKVALENPGADELLAEVGAAESGIPMIIFLDKDGNRIGTSLMMPNGGNIGYPVAPEEIALFGELLEKTAPHMTSEERAMVLDWLRRNAPEV